ncbi:zinc-regulated transporter 2 [Achaetomium macrosporum]|uniref:Zinc-regulated transporter 2 n=1 Tax=Achaetomium macrosporum TaxID=79813 RepID=A0AAN7HF29_9PEZI|nr:zinc-regulated transporter 2 [Achaetomium macrosporum]
MNRPSRTEDDLEHPTWNQNPPFLAADLTTRQDLNGITNAREHRHGCSGRGNGLDLLNDEKHSSDLRVGYLDNDSFNPFPSAMSGRVTRPFIAPKTVLGGEGQACLSRRRIRPPEGWIGWITSVVVVSALINAAGSLLPDLFASGLKPAVQSVAKVEAPLRRLTTRQNTCANSVAGAADYNTPLHVGALLIILAVSSLACATPMLAAKFPILRIPEPFFFGVRHFGTGVLLATAFVHLLPTAFISLGNSCLSSFWTTDYPAMPGAIALVGIFFVSVIEMVFSPARNFIPRVAQPGESCGTEGSGTETRAVPSVMGGGHCSHAAVVATITRPSTIRRASIEPVSLRDTGAPPKNQPTFSKEIREAESQGGGLTPEQVHKKSILQCMLLEVGILFHSVFIGMALSVAIGSDFVVLLIAIAFHQTFEGLALGARIASISWPKKTLQPWLMVLAYGCTTPIGQAIGLATHTLYSPDSEFGLILVGTMNAVSSGLLVFAALIELLAEDFLSDQSWSILRGRKRVTACFLVLLGGLCMSLVGAWA